MGMYRCSPVHPLFDYTPIESGHLIVFPRIPVRIVHSVGETVVTDPNVVMLYNRQGKLPCRLPTIILRARDTTVVVG
ncbi:MAG: hypothetical protein M3220_00240 [Chloroflexota bacterium]|nr:hypothetical protein [Chloroflexota bacterium]